MIVSLSGMHQFPRFISVIDFIGLLRIDIQYKYPALRKCYYLILWYGKSVSAVKLKRFSILKSNLDGVYCMLNDDYGVNSKIYLGKNGLGNSYYYLCDLITKR